MDIFATIVAILVIILVLLFFFIPSFGIIIGMNWLSKKYLPKGNLLVRSVVILAVLLAVPQILNAIINQKITKIVSVSHGEIPKSMSVRKLAVISQKTGNPTLADCSEDCLMLLLSRRIDQYLIAHESSGSVSQEVVAYKFIETTDCSQMNDFVGRRLSSSLENAVRELSLSGTCLTSQESTLDIADVIVSYKDVEASSQFISGIEGNDITVSRRNPETDELTEVYRSVGVRYDSLYPVLLPIITYGKNKPPVDFLKRQVYRSKKNKVVCAVSWFSDYGPCYRQMGRTSASTLLGLRVFERSLIEAGQIASKTARTETITKLVDIIISENRIPSPNEWALIESHISREYHDNDEFAALVINVMSDKRFPVAGFVFGVKILNDEQKALFTSAVVERIRKNNPSPEIGNFNEKQQWYNLYRIIEEMPKETLEPYFKDLVSAALKRPNTKQPVEFLEKFGARSKTPILELIREDKKRLTSLSPVMCKMGTELKGIENPLMEMARTGDIGLSGNYGSLVYLLLDNGINEEQILQTVKPESFQASSKINSIKKHIQRYKNGKKYCR